MDHLRVDGNDVELTKSERIGCWVSTALTKPDPIVWVHGVFDDALKHLDGHPDGVVRTRAQRELFAIRAAVIASVYVEARGYPGSRAGPGARKFP